MRWLWRMLRRGLLALLVLVLLLLAPVAYTELACRGDGTPVAYEAIVDAQHHRPEARTLLTYPEWHIVHAYDDYAQVIAEVDPHDYAYLPSIAGFWSSLCALSKEASTLGPVDGGTKQMVYVIGVSFTAELLAKAAYEETLGRLAAWLRGPERAVLDDVSAQQARGYATFLQQVPWYRWDFSGDAAALTEAGTGDLRDNERALALGLEYRAKAAYAKAIEAAVGAVGADALRLRMVVTGLPVAQLESMGDIQAITTGPKGTEIETPRYRELTGILMQMAGQGAEFAEIAGNDQIMFTALSDGPFDNALTSMKRQGYGDMRHLILLPVADLAEALRGAEAAGLTIEHIHDY